MIQRSHNKKSVTIDVLLLILLIYLTSGFNGGISGTIILLSSLLISITFLIRKSSIKIIPNQKSLIVSLSLLILMGVSLIIEQGNLKQTIIPIGLLLISILLALSFDYQSYSKIFTITLRILSINSLVAFFIALLFPEIIRMFPVLVNSAGTNAHVVGFSFVVLSANVRNWGIFWEPGAFQTFLVMVILIEIHAKNKTSRKFIVIHMIALLTTLSTVGFVGLVLIVIYLVISSGRFSQKLKYIIVATLFSILFFLLYIRNNPYLQYALFDKLLAMFDSNTTSGSAAVRQDSIIYPTQKFLESPIFGVGATGLGELEQITGHTMNTFTPINWFAKWGVFYGSMMIIGLWKYTKYLTIEKFKRFIVFGIILISVSTEEFSTNPTFLIYPLLGLFYNQINVKN